MALSGTPSAAVYGIQAHLIDVELGMPDTAVRESRERIKSALLNSGFGYPNKSVTINLAPANLRNERAGFDLPMPVCARRRGILNLVVPHDNAAEAAVVEGVNVFGLRRLAEVVRLLSRPEEFAPAPRSAEAARPMQTAAPDFHDVRGQATAKRALEVAAAGGHNVLMMWTVINRVEPVLF